MTPLHACEQQGRRRAVALAAAVVVALIAATETTHGQAAPRGAGPVLRSIRVTPAVSAGATTVVLECDGALSEPGSGALVNPPRVYLDLTGVAPAAIDSPGSDALVRRIRVARHSENPLITRVVFDLTRPSTYRIDAAGRSQGRLVVVIQAAGAAPPAPAAALPTAPRAAVRGDEAAAVPNPPPPDRITAPAAIARPHHGVPSMTPREPVVPPRQPAGGADAYDALLVAALERLQVVRPILVSIDRRSEIAADLPATAAELDAIGRMLTAIKPPAARAATHGLLVRTCALGARASRTLQDARRTGDTAGQWNAASAAAGALMLLDRAVKELGP